MGNSLLFRWEDSQALKHHCGFCDRPLSHPAARSSCFGTHAEPCHRFHQAMFMRLRSHTCTFCLTIEEAHWKRHKDIADCLLSIYESCGEAGWSIVPSDLDESGRSRPSEVVIPARKELQRKFVLGEEGSSKRDRRAPKRLTRAVSGSRIIMSDEICYIDSVLHVAEGLSNNSCEGPRNAADLDEIERNLRYHAHVYNTKSKREELKSLIQIHSTDEIVDFNTEMDRILDTFRVNQLIKRNSRNRGLQGKDLKLFQTLVDDLKNAVVEDLVLVHKDFLEIRMRRAGYLRYTNKAAYGILEDRYTDVDWKTGELFASGPSGSSGVASSLEEVGVPESMPHKDPAPGLDSFAQLADRRHLESIHKSLNKDGSPYNQVIEPYHTPLLTLLPDPSPAKKPVLLKIVNLTSPKADSNFSPPRATDAPSPHEKSDNWDSVELQISNSSSKQAMQQNLETVAPAVQASIAVARTQVAKPEQFVASVFDNSDEGHPAISQKKVKKASREAKRKIQRAAAQERSEHILPLLEVDPATPIPSISPRDDGYLENTQEQEASMVVPDIVNSKPVSDVELRASTPTLPITSADKHMHWMKFTRKFVVDQLTDPLLPSGFDCTHNTSCAFETTNVVDCPFHKPHCSCVDPLRDTCFLVLPGNASYYSGPFNRLHGERLMALYEKDSRTKNHLMLVDDDMLDYLMEDPSCRAHARDIGDLPRRLSEEYANFTTGHLPGRLMEQERQFERRLHTNHYTSHRISSKMLQEILRESERPGAEYICYCHDRVPKEENLVDMIMCSHRNCNLVYFHKSCVKKLGFEKVSRFYCTLCAKEMQLLASQMLTRQGCSDLPTGADVGSGFKKALEEVMKMPGNVFKKLGGQGTRFFGFDALAFGVARGIEKTDNAI